MKEETLLNVIVCMQENIKENREYLSDLDREIGDGDHGINMDRGFAEVIKNGLYERPRFSRYSQTTGMTLAFKVGGAWGSMVPPS